MVWSASHKHGNNSLAHHFPSFQLDAAKVASGSVRVEARAPSGRMVEMSVQEVQGVYTANFTPTEVGDWLVSIMYDGQHIQGSPFNVRVYDASQVKVYGLEGGSVGKLLSFSVDCAQAGEGELSVEITHNGRLVPMHMKEDVSKPGVYHVNFTPDGSGVYTIRVLFAGMEVTGSPYKLEIVDSSKVTASGEGLRSVEVNKGAVFIVDTHGGSGGDIKVNVNSPQGVSVPAHVYNNGNGTYRVEYVPIETGDHRVEVLYFGKPINGSPFHASVFDWRRILVENIRSTGMVGRMVEFDIDTSHSGSGNLEIMVNEGTIPCSVQNSGNRRFHATFMPKEPIQHSIQMRFNGKEVPGSPWRVEVRGITKVNATGQGLGLVPVNRMASFEVRAVGSGSFPEDSLRAIITGPSRRPVPVQILNNFNGTYRLEYTPQETGHYHIEVLFDGIPIEGSPFTSKAYSAAAINVGSISPGVVGKPVEFTIDVGRAGEGQLEIAVNHGRVPNSIKSLQKGVYLVSFVPREAHSHLVEIKFNGELLPRCPITVPIMDASRVTVQGEGIHQVAVNKSSFFHVSTQSAGDADLSVRVTSPNGEQVPAKIVQQPDGDYKVEYSSKYTGRHTVEILYAGQAIMGSPFYVEIYDPNKIRVEGVSSGTVGEEITFDIIRYEAGKADLVLNITSPTGRNVPYDIASNSQGERVTYVAREAGVHQIFLTYGGLEIPGVPFTQHVGDSVSVTAIGDGLVKGEEDRPTTFFVDTQGHRGDLSVQVDGPNSIAKCSIEPDSNGRYVVSYTPVEVGIHTITIKWNDKEISGSPFRPCVLDARKVKYKGGFRTYLDANNIMNLQVNEAKTIEFDVSEAGPGMITAEVRGPSGTVPVDIKQSGASLYIVSFMPVTEGEYHLSLWWGGIALPHTPLVGNARGLKAAINHDKVVLTGRGLQHAHVKETAEFVIDGTDAGPGTPDVKLSGVKADVDVVTLSIGGNKYKCSYTPGFPGAYLLSIMWSDRQVRGSPFKVTVTSQSDSSKVVCTGDGLKEGILGKEIKSVIDTRRAGPGELTAHCMGPTKVAYCELYDHHDGTFTLNIKPQEAGRHILQVKYGGEHVPASPFALRVLGAPDASKVRVTGPGIENGILATYQSRFLVETRGAGAGQLTVRIRGPKAAFRVEMQRESQKDRTILCRYDPTEVGDYVIYVKWSDEHVPGSPFNVHIYDTREELENYAIHGQPIRNATPQSHRAWNAEL